MKMTRKELIKEGYIWPRHTGEYEPKITILIVKPRIVQIGWGHVRLNDRGDVDFLREVSEKTMAAVIRQFKNNVSEAFLTKALCEKQVN